jgi:hypothetical protein
VITVHLAWCRADGCNSGQSVDARSCLTRALNLYRAHLTLSPMLSEISGVLLHADDCVWACGNIAVNGMPAAPLPEVPR